jgi:outer membrane protein TolC
VLTTTFGRLLHPALCGATLSLAACLHQPRIHGGESAPDAPNKLWPAPPAAIGRAPVIDTSARRALAALPTELTLADIVDLALRNSPATQLSWAQARASANAFGATRGQIYPTVTAELNAARSRSLAAPGRVAGERTQYGPALTLSYMVLDFGGRSGSIDVARQATIAADLAHNAAVESTILQAELATFGYMATRAQRDAQRAAVDEANAALQAADERHKVGLATIADVLQARTARSQAQLALESLEGALHIARGSLAVAMGLPANAGFDVPDIALSDSVHAMTASVDSLIETAVRTRPELAAARAQSLGAASQLRVARAAALPALGFTATGASNGSNVSTFSGRTYSLNFGVQIPLFTGFSREYDIRGASDQLVAAEARANLTRQQVIQQVFNAYYGLRTATDRVRTSADLLASATQSESVARGRYREGVGSIVDLLIAQSALASARAQEIDARWQWRAALAQLAHDVGVLDLRGEPRLPGMSSRTGGSNR